MVREANTGAFIIEIGLWGMFQYNHTYRDSLITANDSYLFWPIYEYQYAHFQQSQARSARQPSKLQYWLIPQVLGRIDGRPLSRPAMNHGRSKAAFPRIWLSLARVSFRPDAACTLTISAASRILQSWAATVSWCLGLKVSCMRNSRIECTAGPPPLRLRLRRIPAALLRRSRRGVM